MVAAAAPGPGSRILDVACGTCDVALALSRHLKGNTRIIGLDFSYAMLLAGKKKCDQSAGQSIRLVNSDALSLPFRPEAFDAVFIAFGIRNIMDRHRALSEFHMVLKPGGKLAVLELTTPRHKMFKRIYLSYFKKVLPRIGSFFSKDGNAYHYLPASVLQFSSPAEFARLMSETGFSDIRFKPMTLGIVTLFVASRG
jgi:demethylmenaquinone methyltransferase/2-methoxy-6-polyprenyl-1,4-benzoquinol methylase